MSVAQAYGDKISDTLTRVLIDAVGCAGENLSILMDRQIRLQGTAVERVRLERALSRRSTWPSPAISTDT